MIPVRRRAVGADWTAADYDSMAVLLEAGARRPAARVTRARAPRPIRRAVRVLLRAVRSRSGR